MDIPILFEDNTFLAVNKPPGIVVNRAESVQGETVQDWASAYLHIEPGAEKSPEEMDFYARAGIVHRIDKETSGCLLIAKTYPAFIELQRQFKERTVKKIYQAIVHGMLVPPEGEIRAPVGRLPWNRERFGIVPGGKEAVTRYSVKKTFVRQVNSGNRKDSRNSYSLVELMPETGRTHQIRVHLKYINHPIVGDWQYAGRKTARADRVWAPRVMLHAWKIVLEHPVRHEPVAITAPVPDDMNGIINSHS